MSYRNPQIIIDRSAEIWADNISKVGQVVANTIQVYSQAKAEAAAAEKKSREGYSILTAKTAEKTRALIDQAGKTFKGSDKQFEEWQEKARVYGEEILPLQVDNVLNTNLTNEQRADNRKKIGDFEAWLDSSVKSIGGVVDKTSYVTDNKITSANYGRKYIASGNTKMERFNNYAAGFGLTNQEIEGMTLESYNAGDRGDETIGVKYSITAEQYKKFVDNKMLDEGALGEPDDKGNYHGKWERNLKKWGSSDQQLFREIFDEGDVNEALKLAGFIDDNGKWTNKHLATEVRSEVIDGVEYTRQHINPDGIFKDKTYEGVKKSQAKALLAMGDEESFHALSRLGWGDKVTIEQWNNRSEEDKEEILYQLMFEQDMSRLMGLPNGQLPETRVANEGDVDYYKEMGWGDITAGKDHIWFTTKKASKVNPTGKGGLTKAEIRAKKIEKAEQEQFDFDVKTAIWNKPINMENLLAATGKLGLDMNAEAVTNEEGEIVAYSVINKKGKGKTTINKTDTDNEVTKKLLMALGYNTKRISDTDIWGIRSESTNKNKGAAGDSGESSKAKAQELIAKYINK